MSIFDKQFPSTLYAKEREDVWCCDANISIY